MMLASTWVSSSGQYTGAPVARATGVDGTDVVEVGVGEQDRLDGLDLERLERAEDPLGLVTGIDDHRPVGVLGPHDVGVLLHRADREHAHVEHRRQPPFFCWRRRYR